MIAQSILANVDSLGGGYKNWMEQINSEALNYQSTFAVKQTTAAGKMSALDMSNAYMALKQRKPFIIEYNKYDQATNKVSTKSITMYINPEKLSITYQKMIAKAVTRGGIFYNHWGNNDAQLSLSGTTGLSGMSGIKQLEEVYFASGSLLRYNNFMPTQVYGNVANFETLDYSDPIEIASNVNNSNYSSSTIDSIAKKLLEYSGSSNTNETYNTVNYLNLYKNNAQLNNFINNDLKSIYSNVSSTDKTSTKHYREYYNLILSGLTSTLPTTNNAILTGLAYELSLQKLYSNLQYKDYATALSNSEAPILSSMKSFQEARNSAMQEYFTQMKEFNNRDANILSALKGGFINVTGDMEDLWLPRKITIYFESRAYIGHFESFNYTRDAKTNLINYDMKFVITCQYDFTNDADAHVVTDSSSLNLSTNNSNSTGDKKTSKNVYIVQDGDSLDTIAQKFYGDVSYWPEIWAANLDKIEYANLIYPGQQLTINPLPDGYWNWVTMPGNTLESIASRFYGDSSKWQRIYDVNRNLITSPAFADNKIVLKIPK